MKNLLTLSTLCLLHFSVSATHLFGGYITTRKLTARKYEVRVIVQNDPASAASGNLAFINLSYGDGSTETVQRLSQENQEDHFRTNIYVSTHEYASDGLFTISYEDPNLIDMIVNVNHGSSANASLRMSALIRVSTVVQSSEEPHALAYTLPVAAIGQRFTYNPTFVDMDGDSIACELITASQSDLPAYVLPNGIRMNPYSGMITWDQPANAGYYLVQYTVSSYDKGVLLSKTLVTQPIRVSDLPLSFPPTVSFPNADLAPAGWYRSVVNNPGQVTQSFVVPVTPNAMACSIQVYSELLLSTGRLDATQTDSQQVVQFSWDALAGMIRSNPYFVTFRLQSNTYARASKDYDLAFYHGAPLTTSTPAVQDLNNQVLVYPNPSAAGSCFFQLPPALAKATLRIYTVSGKTVLTTRIQGPFYTWEHAHETPGLYLYEVNLEDGKTLRGKMVLE